jgi:hypothetical protein
VLRVAAALCVLFALGLLPAAAAEIGGGCDDFTLNRAAMAYLVAYAVAGGDAAVPTGPAVPSFTDVPADYWAYRYVEYCLAKGITTGYQTGVYGPADTATREQMAAFTSRAHRLLGLSLHRVPEPARGGCCLQHRSDDV